MNQEMENRFLFDDPSKQNPMPPEPKLAKWKWRPKAERDAAKRDREIRRERRQAKQAEKKERWKRRETKKALRTELAVSPPEILATFQPRLKCRDCGGGFIVAMPRDPETGDNLPICERCL